MMLLRCVEVDNPGCHRVVAWMVMYGAMADKSRRMAANVLKRLWKDEAGTRRNEPWDGMHMRTRVADEGGVHVRCRGGFFLKGIFRTGFRKPSFALD